MTKIDEIAIVYTKDVYILNILITINIVTNTIWLLLLRFLNWWNSNFGV